MVLGSGVATEIVTSTATGRRAAALVRSDPAQRLARCCGPAPRVGWASLANLSVIGSTNFEHLGGGKIATDSTRVRVRTWAGAAKKSLKKLQKGVDNE